MLFSHSGVFEGARNSPWVCSVDISTQARAMQKCNKIREVKYWKIEQKALLMYVFSIVSLGRAGMEITAHN